jgi:hypothetical protein
MMDQTLASPRLRTRRQELMIRYTAITAGSVILASAALLIYRSRTRHYVPGEQVKEITNELARNLPSDYPRVEFTDVARQAGVNFHHFPGTRTTQLPEDMGSGAAWGDYDGDGFLDLYIADIAAPLTASPEQMAASPGGNRLYHNNAGRTFTDVTAKAGVGYKGLCNGVAWGDYDNDGRPDLAVSCYDHLILYHNNGDGTFSDVSHKVGFDKYRGFFAGVSWGDYDRDGFADLYVCRYVRYEYDPSKVGASSRRFAAVVPYMINPSSFPPEGNLLFHNNGRGSFTEVARKAGVEDAQNRNLSAAWCDLNGDGWPDIYVASDVSENKLYLNLRNGRFKDVSEEAWVNEYRGSMGLGIGDFDNDGDFDIFITHWMAQGFALFQNLRFNPAHQDRAGPLHFEDVADMEGGLSSLTLGDIGWGTSFFDYDNDGRLDLFAVDGSTFEDPTDTRRLLPMKNHLLWQKSPEAGFFDVGSVSGSVFSEKHGGRGAAFADYDNDGNVDVLVVNYQEPAMLLHNGGGSKNHWIEIRLQCARSNRSGLGTRIELEAGGMKQYQQVGSQPSYLSGNSLVSHFGLGQAEQVDRLRVTFPSGAVQEMDHIPSNQIILVSEP